MKKIKILKFKIQIKNLINNNNINNKNKIMNNNKINYKMKNKNTN